MNNRKEDSKIIKNDNHQPTNDEIGNNIADELADIKLEKEIESKDKKELTEQKLDEREQKSLSEESETNKDLDESTKTQTDLKQALEDAKNYKNEAEKWKDDCLRLAADFENYKRRNRQELEQRLKFSTQSLAEDIIGCLDDLELALDHIKNSTAINVEDLKKGLDMSLNKFFDVLKGHQILSIEALGKKFDPSIHEAVVAKKDEAVPENHISKVFKRGYVLHDRVIRPSMVQVSQSND